MAASGNGLGAPAADGKATDAVDYSDEDELAADDSIPISSPAAKPTLAK